MALQPGRSTSADSRGDLNPDQSPPSTSLSIGAVWDVSRSSPGSVCGHADECGHQDDCGVEDELGSGSSRSSTVSSSLPPAVELEPEPVCEDAEPPSAGYVSYFWVGVSTVISSYCTTSVCVHAPKAMREPAVIIVNLLSNITIFPLGLVSILNIRQYLHL